MDIKSLISSGVQIVATAADLKEFALAIIEEAKELAQQPEEVYYTREQFAQRKGVSLGTLWRWERAGILKGTRRGSRVFYRDQDLIEK